ncbi:MAG: hypothetical protein Q8R92_01640 [Deltaproteobacteria bacterium]|nr:hypothetical protein [Deltaproteobacteria bacterium]
MSQMQEAEAKFEAEATQYLLPDGEQRTRVIELPESLRPQYEAMRACGCRLTGEMLRTGEVSFAIEHPEADYDLVVVPNGPEGTATWHDMIRRLDRAEFEKWLAQFGEESAS